MNRLATWMAALAMGGVAACSSSSHSDPGCTGAACGFATLESFDTGTWVWAPWVAPGGSSYGGTPTASCAHDGARGMLDPDWYYRGDVVIGAAGDELQEWVNPSTSGRVYLGFGSNATATWAFVAGTNTNQLILMRVQYGTTSTTYTNLATVTQTYTPNTWYRMRVVFGAGGNVTGQLFAADGTTLLNSVSATLSGFAPGGVAIRSFGWCSDTIEF